MARVEELSFTKSWRSQEDFPTYEESEEQVREDLQCLFDEIRDFLNRRLLPAVNAISAAEVTMASGSSLESAMSALRSELVGITLGQLPDGSVTAEKLSPGSVALSHLAPEVLGFREVTDQIGVAGVSGGDMTGQDLRFYYSDMLRAMFLCGTVTFAARGESTQYQKLRVTAPAYPMGQMLLCASRGAGFTFDARAVFSPGEEAGELDVTCRSHMTTCPAGSVELVGFCLCGEVTA